MPIAAVVLAAGASTRLGRPKQLLELQGETLLARAIRLANEAGFSPVFAVLSPELDFGYAAQQLGAIVILNDRVAEGMAASIRLGVQAAQLLKASGVVLMACDQPALTVEHLLELTENPEERTGSAYAERIGIPAYFPEDDFAELMTLKGDQGARKLLLEARSIRDEGLALDIDTEEDVARTFGARVRRKQEVGNRK